MFARRWRPAGVAAVGVEAIYVRLTLRYVRSAG